MYDRLKVLEKTILDIKEQYQLVSDELSQLKKQPTPDPKELVALKAKLENSYAERENSKKQLGEFDSRYQSLAEAHHMLGDEQDNLQKQLSQLQQKNSELQQLNEELKQQSAILQQQNNDLQEKNQLAAERTQVVLQRLTRIDQMDS